MANLIPWKKEKSDLQIRREKEEKGQHFYQVERSYGSIHRSITLPGEVDEKEIDATFKRGVLKVKLPKTKEAQEERKRITIKSGQ